MKICHVKVTKTCTTDCSSLYKYLKLLAPPYAAQFVSLSQVGLHLEGCMVELLEQFLIGVEDSYWAGHRVGKCRLSRLDHKQLYESLLVGMYKICYGKL